MENILYYVFALVVLVVAFTILKKVASCMIKSVVMIALVLVLLAIYYLYFMQ